jgi:hypothetical protein
VLREDPTTISGQRCHRQDSQVQLMHSPSTCALTMHSSKGDLTLTQTVMKFPHAPHVNSPGASAAAPHAGTAKSL